VHRYIAPEFVRDEMEKLCNWITESEQKLHPVIVSALAHFNFVAIHPFNDGNGRGARILMNLLLTRAGFPPAVIKSDIRSEYIDALAKGDKGDLTEFILLIARVLKETLKESLSEFK